MRECDFEGWRRSFEVLAVVRGAGGCNIRNMPTLFRLVVILGLLGGFAYGAVLLLAYAVQPSQRDIIVNIPAEHFTKRN